jgi:thioredoxin-related protein
MLRLVLFSFFLLLLPTTSAPLKAASTGKVVGGQNHRAPDWFKETFLDFKEDASEAAAEGKHVMVFFDLDGCPYCARMMSESVEPQRALIEPFFDSIAINIKGDREVSTDGENQMTEKQLAKKLKIRFTPTIVFLDENAKPVFRINGFWNPAQFRIALSFVKTRSYKKMKIRAFAKLQKRKPVYALKDHPQLKNMTDLSTVKTPLLVLFEDETCSACAELHQSVLNRKDVTDALKNFTFVRFNAGKNTAIVTPDGTKTTMEKWAETLAIRTSPTFIAFDNAKEIQRVDGTLYSYHFSSILQYVANKNYEKFDNWLAFMGNRTRNSLKKGKNVDLSKDGVTLTQ